MPLPQGADYLRSVQNPKLAFADSDLKFSSPELTPQGLPKPYSGGFTTTFKLTRSNFAWAVRCFTRPLGDLQSRYRAITDFASRNGNSHFVRTHYLREGILVSGTWYPTIKMDWVTGEPLNRYVERNIADVGELSAMAASFRKLVGDLAGYGVAHGDLQHGNILVHNGTLRVIDYDGMYLPSIACYGGNNSGHPNYQHPGRNGSHFSTSIDNFSAIVIYTAMLALSQDSSLWKKYNNDENTLFRQGDFIDPDKSILFRDLRALAKPLPEYADRISTLCRCDFAYVPSLEAFLSGPQPVISTSPSRYLPRSPYAMFSAADSGAILENTGQRVEIVGQIKGYHYGTTRYGKPYLFLNMTQPYPYHTFTIVLWSQALEAFGKQNDSMQYLGQWVSVIGVVEAYTGKPQIAVEVLSQVTRLADESEAKDRLNTATRTMQAVVAAPTEIVRKSVPPAVYPIQDFRSREAEVFSGLYGSNRPSTSSRPTPDVTTPTSSGPKPNMATPTPSHSKPSVTTPASPNPSRTSQKPTHQPDFWERLRKFLIGE